MIPNPIIILYFSISYQLIFSIAYFIPYLYKNLTFITILYYNIFIDTSCRTILFNYLYSIARFQAGRLAPSLLLPKGLSVTSVSARLPF